MSNNQDKIEERIEYGKMQGKSTRQKLEIMDEVFEGDKYILIKGYKKEVHILPKDKLDKARQQERERIVGVLEGMEKESVVGSQTKTIGYNQALKEAINEIEEEGEK